MYCSVFATPIKARTSSSSLQGNKSCLFLHFHSFLACSRLSDSWDGTKIRKGTQKQDAQNLPSPFAFFRALFLNSRFPHYLGAWNRLLFFGGKMLSLIVYSRTNSNSEFLTEFDTIANLKWARLFMFMNVESLSGTAQPILNWGGG